MCIRDRGYRDVWMFVRFFNASTGLIHQFFNKGAPNPNVTSPTIDQYQTKLKYTRVRLYKDYTYMICKRDIPNPSMVNPFTIIPGWTSITDSDSEGIGGSFGLPLYEIRIQS